MADFDFETCMGRVTSEIMHLHSLYLAYNNLTPKNIMLDEHDNVFRIDVGFSKPFGRILIKVGTLYSMQDCGSNFRFRL
jgi:tRNA A-37 threonylcarbamoyl transferase component Bud32